MRINNIFGMLFLAFNGMFVFANNNVNIPSPPPPPTNDECSSAILLTVGTSCSFTQYTNAQATASSGIPAPGCASYSGGDVWFKAVVPTNGRLIIDTQTGVLTDGGMAIYSGSCGSLSLIECDDDDSSNGMMPKIDRSGLTPGTTIYIRVWEYGNNNNGTFSICVSSPTAVDPGATTCSEADPFCTGTGLVFPASVNAGTGQSGPDYGCLCSQPNPVWYYLRIANPGSLTINISSTCGDVDYAAWGPFSTLSCSSGALSSTVSSCGGNLSAPAGNMVDCAYSTSATEALAIPNALTGQYYMVMITNYANCVGNINFNQTSGTGSTDCSIIAPPVSNNGPLCVGQTLNLTVSVPMAGATYAWTGPNGFTSTTMNPSITNVTLNNAGVYSLVITVGGVSSAAVTTAVSINAAPIATASSNSPICSGSVLNLTSSGGTSYAWSGPNSYTSSTQNPSIALSPATATGVYTVTVTVAGGCTATAQTTVTVNATPTPTASNNGPLCPGNTLNLTSTPAGADSYAWSGPNSFTNTAQNPSVTSIAPASSGTYTVTVTATGGCTATAQTTLSISGNVAVFPTSNSPICQNQSLNLSASLPGASYAWSGPNSFTSTIQNPTIANSPTVATGTYQVTVTSSSGCTGSGSVSVVINPLPVIVITGDTTICSGQNTVLSATGGVSYLWSNTLAFADITVNPIVQTTYTVTVTTDLGCTSTASKTVFINVNPSIDNVVTTNEFCNKGNGQAIASVNSGLAPYQYVWSNGASNCATSIMMSTGQYSVTVTDDNGCSASASFSIQNTPGPELSITNVNNDHCSQAIGSATVIAANIPGNYTYSWLTNPPQQGITATGLSAGVYLAVVTDSTCYDTLAVAISNIEGPTALFETTPPSASSTNPVIRFINQTEGMHSSYWTFGDGATSHMESPIHEYLLSDSFVVVLEVADTYGCIDTVSKTVLIYDDINVFIPNAFSPNEDGLNEVFKPVGRGVNPASPYEMIIYDRWGKMVFSTNKFEEGWNGYVRGSKIKVTGTFIYRITLYDFANKKHVYKGNFSFLGSKSDGDF